MAPKSSDGAVARTTCGRLRPLARLSGHSWVQREIFSAWLRAPSIVAQELKIKTLNKIKKIN